MAEGNEVDGGGRSTTRRAEIDNKELEQRAKINDKKFMAEAAPNRERRNQL